VVGHLYVALPPDRAFRLFTARGERDWAAGWQPRFPVPADDDAVAGAVFQTGSHGPGGRTTVWVVADSDPGRAVRYVRITPEVTAAEVSVALEPERGGSRVTVGYRMTALSPAADAEVEEFAAGYRPYLASWERDIAALLARD
jgi:hypothetical protein